MFTSCLFTQLSYGSRNAIIARASYGSVVGGLPSVDPDLMPVVRDYRGYFPDVNISSFCYVWRSNMRRTSGLMDFRGRIVKLSQEIHQQLPEGEWWATLLHEVVHVALFMRGDGGHDDHGPTFLAESVG